MHGGDSLFGRMTSASHVYRDSGVDSELDHKAYKVTEKLSESINTIANEPSVAFYRIQEHVRKTLPQLVEQKHEVEEVQQLVQGACFDTEYAGNAVKGMQKSVVHFQNIQELLKNAMFMKQQIDYEDARKRQGKAAAPGSNGRAEGQTGGKAEEGSDTNMDDSAVSTDSSLAASAHMCTNPEESSEASQGTTGEQATTEGDAQEEKDSAASQNTLEKTDTAAKHEDRSEEKRRAEKDEAQQEKDVPDIGDKEQTNSGEENREEGKDEAETEETQNRNPEDKPETMPEAVES